MFDNSDSFFNFIFACIDDCYITDSGLKLDLRSYLKLIFYSRFKHLYIITQDPVYHNNYFLDYVKPDNNSHRFFWIRSTSNETKNVEKEDLLKKLDSIIDELKNNSYCAIVMPVNIFFDKCQKDPKFVKILSENSRKRNNKNRIILLSNVDSDIDNYFQNVNEYGYVENIDKDAPQNPFFNEDLFPYITQKYAEVSQSCYYANIFSLLSEALGERMELFNDMSYNKIKNAVTYMFMKTDYIPVEYINDYINIIYLWYNDIFFHDRYYETAIGNPNPKRKISELMASLENSDFRKRIEDIADKRIRYNKIDCPDRGYVNCFSKQIGDNTLLIKFRNLLRKTSVSTIDEKMTNNLVAFISDMTQHSFITNHNSVYPIYYTLKSQNGSLVKAMKAIENKIDQNQTIDLIDEKILCMIYHLFMYCKKDLKGTEYQPDTFHRQRTTKMNYVLRWLDQVYNEPRNEEINHYIRITDDYIDEMRLN